MRSIKIIEKLTVGKHDLATCEDGIVATSSHVAVIDGSTSKAAVQLSPTMRNGRLAMMLVSEVVERLSPPPPARSFATWLPITSTLATRTITFLANV